MTDDSEQGAELSADADKPASTSGVVSRLRNYFLTGLVVAGPVAVTAWLIWWFVTWVDNLVRPVIPVAYRPETYLPFNIPGLGLIIVLLALTLLGFLTANLVGSRLVSFGESLLEPHADRAADLPHHQTDFRNAVFGLGIEFPQCRAGRVSRARDVVAGIFDPTAKPADFGSPAGE